MNDWLEASRWYIGQLNPVLAQESESFGGNIFFRNAGIDPTYAIYFLVGMMIAILLIVYGTIRYSRWKKYKVFEDELKTLDLDPNSEGTLAGMVRRYAMDEPVQILCSVRLFDEMATSEMLRVLASPASLKLKQEFIDTVYSIRNKTYHPEWSERENEKEKNEIDLYDESYQEV